jgi:hypothetical protein
MFVASEGCEQHDAQLTRPGQVAAYGAEQPFAFVGGVDRVLAVGLQVYAALHAHPAAARDPLHRMPCPLANARPRRGLGY